jgi:hypothetical protein
VAAPPGRTTPSAWDAGTIATLSLFYLLPGSLTHRDASVTLLCSRRFISLYCWPPGERSGPLESEIGSHA